MVIIHSAQTYIKYYKKDIPQKINKIQNKLSLLAAITLDFLEDDGELQQVLKDLDEFLFKI